MMDITNVATIAAIVVGGGGVAGAIVALIKVRPEAGQIAVTAAGGALIVQAGVIETLREEMRDLRLRVDQLEDERDTLRVQAREAEEAALRSRSEAKALKARVTRLETQIRALGHTPVDGKE